MKPILFEKTATTFNTNGIGRLEAISCIVNEERNGIFEMEMTIAETALHASEIEMQSIIVVKVPDKQNLQAFRVYKMTKPINGIFKVLAQHISYQLSFIPVMPFTVTASLSACNETLQALKTNAVEDCPFTFFTDVTTVASYSQSAPASIRSRLGGVAGSVLDQFGGEYSWDNYEVSLLRNRGVTTPTVTLRYGKNITDLNQEENIADTITGIVPFWQSSEGDTMVTLPEKVINSSYASAYPFKRTVPYDFSSEFQEEPTQPQLRAKAQAYMNASGVGVPKVSIKVSFVSLADTEEFKDVADLQNVNLCDNVGVYFEKLGISTTAEIVKVEYNVLLEKYDSVEIGSLRSNLAGAINANSQGITQLANNTHRMFKEYNGTVNQIVDEATTWLTSGDGFVVAHKDPNTGEWKELLFMDTADEATAHNVLRINQNGIGFSSTGVAGPYTQAWTLDGRMVIGGTNVPSLTVYDSNQNIIFQTSRSGTIWNSNNSSMDASGVLRAVGAILTNAQIISTNTTGSGVDVNAINGKIVFKWQGIDIATINATQQNDTTFLEISSEDFIRILADDTIRLIAQEDLTLVAYNGGTSLQGNSVRVISDSSVRISNSNNNHSQIYMDNDANGYFTEIDAGRALDNYYSYIYVSQEEGIKLENAYRVSSSSYHNGHISLSYDRLYMAVYGGGYIECSDGDVAISGDIYLNRYEITRGGSAIADFYVNYDWDTGFVNQISDYEYVNVWEWN